METLIWHWCCSPISAPSCVLSPLFLAQIIWNKKCTFITILEIEIRKMYINIKFSSALIHNTRFRYSLTSDPSSSHELITCYWCNKSSESLYWLQLYYHCGVQSGSLSWGSVTRRHGDPPPPPRHTSLPRHQAAGSLVVNTVTSTSDRSTCHDRMIWLCNDNIWLWYDKIM